MDLLKQELLKKRRILAAEAGGRKIFRRSEIEQMEKKIQEREKLEAEAKTARKPNTLPPAAVGTNPSAVSRAAASKDEQNTDYLDLPRMEIIRRLRFLKQPITVFGEDDAVRIDRLKYVLKAGLFELDGDLTEGQTNDFLRDILEMSKRQKSGISTNTRKGKNREEEQNGDDDDEISNFDDLCDEDKIRIFFNRLLNELSQELDEMPDAEKRSREGRDMVAKFKQCVRDSNPLFESCRKKVLPDDIRRALLLVVESCRKREYQVAMHHYVRLAIGNSPWPIGVTMVGIHERSAREKIFTSSVAHIMNDETTRKYLQSVKRLMTFCQRRYPTAPSKAFEFNTCSTI